MGRSLSQRWCLVRLVYLPSPRTHSVVARGPGILACQTRPTVPHFYQHTYQAGTDLRQSLLGAVSTRKIGVEPGNHVWSVLADSRRWVAVCPNGEGWRGTDYEAGGERQDVMVNKCAHILLVGCGKDGPARGENR